VKFLLLFKKGFYPVTTFIKGSVNLVKTIAFSILYYFASIIDTLCFVLCFCTFHLVNQITFVFFMILKHTSALSFLL